MLFNGTGDIGATVSLGGAAMPATKFPCRSCHGRDGAGGREGAVPPIRKIDLARATPARPAYDEEALRRALEEGTAPDGRPFGNAMPRYALDDAIFESLSLYLERLPDLQRQGISSDAIVIGVALPPDNAMVGRRYADLLRKAVDAALPGGAVHGRRIAVDVIEGTPEAMADRAEKHVAAVVGFPPSSALGIEAFTDRQVPVMFPLFPLDGDEDASIVRGMMADRQDGLRALADRVASDGVKRLVVPESPGCGSAVADFVRRFAREGVRYETVPFPLPPGFTAGADDAFLLLCGDRRIAGAILDGLPAQVPVYGLASEMLSASGSQSIRHRMILAAQEAAFLSRGDRPRGETMLEAHAAMAAHVLVLALTENGRALTRTSLVASVGLLQAPETGLDYGRDALNGTSLVGFIETRPAGK